MINKETCLALIKAKLGSTQKISDRTIKENIEALSILFTEDKTDDEFVNGTFKIFEEINVNHIKDVSDQYKVLQKEFEDRQKAVTKTDTNESSLKIDDFLSSLGLTAAEIKETVAFKNQMQAKEVIETKRNELKAKLIKLGASETWVEAAINTYEISDGTDIESSSDSLLKLYNVSNANINGTTPKGAEGKGFSQADIDAMVNQLK